MATYFHGNQEIQSQSASVEGLQTLVLMNRNFPQFADANSPNNFFFVNSAAMTNVAHPSPATSTPPFVGLAMDHDLHGALPRLHYNMYNPMEQSSSTKSQQGLSLSLSSHQQPPLLPGFPALCVENLRASGSLLGSKYLKPVQELLDEVVSVSFKNTLSEKRRNRSTPTIAAGDYDGTGKAVQELSITEKQEVQKKKEKLLAMLDEVEQRYRQYDHQMQLVKASIEQAAGAGAANSYSALALGTISKQFKSLKDAIVSQIKTANVSLGEEEKPESSRMKFVDHQYRQQRAMQQLGMMQHNTWRPQRGLPERSVSFLRAWLFENFLHPYPKDSDKLMLAKRTGLTRSQVSNWFINARVRLWKPMVEEMYMEEIKLHEKSNSASIAKSSENEETMNKQPNVAISVATGELKSENKHKKVGDADMLQPLPFSSAISMDIKPREAPVDQISRDGLGLSRFEGYGQYPMADVGRFDADHFAPRVSGNGVSLTLGLPNQELMSLSSPHQSFLHNQSVHLGRRVEHDEPNEFIPSSSSSAAFESFNNIQNRKRFAAQLLPADFVA